jgi:hypothetical protein
MAQKQAGLHWQEESVVGDIGLKHTGTVHHRHGLLVDCSLVGSERVGIVFDRGKRIEELGI